MVPLTRPWADWAQTKITRSTHGRTYEAAVRAYATGKSEVVNEGLLARRVKTAKGALWIVGTPVNLASAPAWVHLVAYPEAEHAEALVNYLASHDVKEEGPSESNPGGVGTLKLTLRSFEGRRLRSYKRTLMERLRKHRAYLHKSLSPFYAVTLAQAHFKTSGENQLAGNVVNKVSKWRPRLVQEAMRIAAEYGADLVVDARDLTKMTNKLFFLETVAGFAEKNGVECVRGKGVLLVKTSQLNAAERTKLL